MIGGQKHALPTRKPEEPIYKKALGFNFVNPEKSCLQCCIVLIL